MWVTCTKFDWIWGAEKLLPRRIRTRGCTSDTDIGSDDGMWTQSSRIRKSCVSQHDKCFKLGLRRTTVVSCIIKPTDRGLLKYSKREENKNI